VEIGTLVYPDNQRTIWNLFLVGTVLTPKETASRLEAPVRGKREKGTKKGNKKGNKKEKRPTRPSGTGYTVKKHYSIQETGYITLRYTVLHGLASPVRQRHMMGEEAEAVRRVAAEGGQTLPFAIEETSISSAFYSSHHHHHHHHQTKT